MVLFTLNVIVSLQPVNTHLWVKLENGEESTHMLWSFKKHTGPLKWMKWWTIKWGVLHGFLPNIDFLLTHAPLANTWFSLHVVILLLLCLCHSLCHHFCIPHVTLIHHQLISPSMLLQAPKSSFWNHLPTWLSRHLNIYVNTRGVHVLNARAFVYRKFETDIIWDSYLKT